MTSDRKSIVKQIRDRYPAEYGLHLSFGECGITVKSDREAVIEGLREYFTGWAEPPNPTRDSSDILISVHEALPPDLPVSFISKSPDPGKSKIKEEYSDLPDGRIVRKRLTGMIFVFGGDENVAVGPCLDNLNQIVNFINNRHIERKLCQGALLGHAAGVIWKEKGLALAGFSGAGKSTLALYLMNRGAVFVSNDRLMIEKKSLSDTEIRLFMHGVAKLPRVNPGTVLNNPNLRDIMSDQDREHFSLLSAEELWNVEHKYDAPIDSCFGPGRFVLSSRMHGLVILNWNKGQGITEAKEVCLSERRDLLPAFMKSVGLFFSAEGDCLMPEPSAENYLDYLSLCRILEIKGKIDFEKAADACVSFLEKG